MATFRVEKNSNYTVMSNYHLRDKSLSLKAKGMLSYMLSLPEDWDYTARGLSAVCKEGVDAIRSVIQELEQHGYLSRQRVRNADGRLAEMEYLIREVPEKPISTPSVPGTGNPVQGTASRHRKSCAEKHKTSCTAKQAVQQAAETNAPQVQKPVLENPVQAFSMQENTAQINNNIIINTKTKKEKLSYPISKKEQKQPAFQMDEMEQRTRYHELIKENIQYDILMQDPQVDTEQLTELLELLTDTVCTARTSLRIAGGDCSAQVVKAQLLKLNSEHIRYVLQCLEENTSRIRNIRSYLLTALYHAPNTMSSYYTARVRHDMSC